jgi:hypothetical protein
LTEVTMARGEDALVRAQKAIEEYDYEAALAAFSEAHAAGRREAAFLVTYAGFLLDQFGDYVRAHEILKNEAKALAKSKALQRLAVRAACLAGDVEAGLAAARAWPEAVSEDSETQLAYAKMLVPSGAASEARRVLTKLLQADPGNLDARALLQQVDERLTARVSDRLAGVEPLLEKGDLGSARALLAEALALDPDAREAHRLRRRLEEALLSRRVAEARERMAESEASGDLEGALRIADEALALAPGDADLQQAAARLSGLALHARLLALAGRALDLEAASDLEGAARAWNDVLRVPEGAACLSEQNPGTLLSALVAEQRATDPARLDTAAGVTALVGLLAVEARGPLEEQDVDDLRRWLGQLGPLPRLDRALAAAEARKAAAQRIRLDGLRQQAEQALAAGAIADGLALLRSLGAHGGADARAREIEARLSDAERRLEAADAVRRAVAAADVFLSRKLLGAATRAGVEAETLATLDADVRALADQHLGVLPAVPVFDDPFERFPLVAGGYARLGDAHLVVLYAGSLLVWNTEGCRDDGVWDLPAPLRGTEKNRYLLLRRSADVALVHDRVARAVYSLEVRPGRRPVLLERCPLERVLPEDPTQSRISIVPSADGRSLLVLVTSLRPERKPTLTVVDLDEQRTTSETELPFPAFRLLAIANRPGEYGVSRLLTNPPGAVPRWDFAVINERGRVGASTRFEGLGELIHGVRRLHWEPRVSKYFYSFDTYEPFSGQVTEESIGLGIAKGDLSPFFFEARMEDKLGSRRYVVGDATPLPSLERLLLPWRDTDHNVGLAAFPWLDPSRATEVTLGPGDLVLDVFPHGDGDHGVAVLYDREKKAGRCAAYHL